MCLQEHAGGSCQADLVLAALGLLMGTDETQ